LKTISKNVLKFNHIITERNFVIFTIKHWQAVYWIHPQQELEKNQQERSLKQKKNCKNFNYRIYWTPKSYKNILIYT